MKKRKRMPSMFVNAQLMLFVVIAVLTLTPEWVPAEYGDVIINNRAEKNGMRPVIFPHWFHRIRFKCKVCHLELGFNMKAGSNYITMEKIVDGKFCGACHNGKVAWSPINCDMCHSGKAGIETGIKRGHVTGGAGFL